MIIGWVALITLGVMFGSTPIDDLRTGQCFTADGLTDDETGGVRSIEVVECSESHDAEVVGTNELDADEAADYADLSAEDLCRPLVDADALADSEQDLTVTALTQTTEPSAGDLMVCAAHTRDGAPLVGPLG